MESLKRIKVEEPRAIDSMISEIDTLDDISEITALAEKINSTIKAEEKKCIEEFNKRKQCVLDKAFDRKDGIMSRRFEAERKEMGLEGETVTQFLARISQDKEWVDDEYNYYACSHCFCTGSDKAVKIKRPRGTPRQCKREVWDLSLCSSCFTPSMKSVKIKICKAGLRNYVMADNIDKYARDNANWKKSRTCNPKFCDCFNKVDGHSKANTEIFAMRIKPETPVYRSGVGGVITFDPEIKLCKDCREHRLDEVMKEFRDGVYNGTRTFIKK